MRNPKDARPLGELPEKQKKVQTKEYCLEVSLSAYQERGNHRERNEGHQLRSEREEEAPRPAFVTLSS